MYLQCLCLLDGFFLWVLCSDLLGLSLWPFFRSRFCLIWVLLPMLFVSCPFAWKICFQPFTFCCVGVLSWGGSLVGSICVGHVFLSIQLFYVFWLEHLIHLRLRLLSIGSYSLPLFLPVLLCLSLFLPFLKAVPSASLAEMIWWKCIRLDFFCLGNSLFGLLSWLRALLVKVVLVAGLWFSLLGIFFAILFCLGVFPLRSQLLTLLRLPCMFLPVSPLLPLRSSLCLGILPFKFWCVFRWASLGSSCLGLSVFPGFGWLFLSSD